MTLKERLESIPEDKLIYLGVISGYALIGTKDMILDKHEILTALWLRKLNYYLRVANMTLECAPPRIEIYKNRLATEKSYEEIFKLQNLIKQNELNVAVASKKLNYYTKLLNEFVPAIDREIIDEYELDGGYNKGLAIIIKSREPGDYWTYDECEKMPIDVIYKDYCVRTKSVRTDSIYIGKQVKRMLAKERGYT